MALTEHRWPLSSYWISLAVSATNVTGVNDFRTISFETVRIGSTRYSGTLWFWTGEPAHGNLPNADSVGHFRRGRLNGFIRPEFFESVYALVRSERPALLHFEEEDGTVVILELLAIEEPVGEIDRSLPVPDYGFSDLIEELDAAVRNFG